jgi:hypothetical protein
MEIGQEYKDAIVEFVGIHRFMIQTFKMEKRTIEEWTKHFSVDIPTDTSDILGTQKALTKVTILMMECSDIYSQINLSTMFKEMMNNDIFQKRSSELLSSKNVSTNNKATSIAKGELAKDNRSLEVGKLVREFFEEQLKKLRSVAKNLETIANSQMSEMKNLNKYRYNDAS